MRAATAAVVACAVWLLLDLARGGYPAAAAFFGCLAALWRLRRSPASSDAALFFAVAAAYLSTFRWRGGDDGPTILVPFSALRHGTLALDPFIERWFGEGKHELFTVAAGERRLSIFPIVGSILALPFCVPAALSGVELTDAFLHQLSKLSACAITAASVVAFRRAVAGRCSAVWSATLTSAYAFGTWAFSVSSQGLWQHGPSSLGLALGLLGLSGNGRASGALAGFGMALAAAARPDTAFGLAAAGVVLLAGDRRRLLPFAAGAAVPLALLLWYWLHYTGRPLPPEHGFQARHFAGFQLQAFAGLAVSPTRGLLFYCPAAVFGLLALLRGPADARILAAAALAPWALLSFYVTWVGGNTFGPRYFASTSLVLLWACASLEAPLRGCRAAQAFAAAVVWSVLVHAAGAYLTWPGSQAFDAQRAALWDVSLHPLARLPAADGPLHRLPGAVRLALCAAIVGAAVHGARSLARVLSGQQTQSSRGR